MYIWCIFIVLKPLLPLEIIYVYMIFHIKYIDALVQACRNPGALAMELLQSWAKPSMYVVKAFQIPSNSAVC